METIFGALTITLCGVLPPNRSATASSACFSRSAGSMSTGTSSLARTLPLICTTAVTVMLVLTTALCASLTMLLQQSLRYVSAQSHNAAMQNAGGKETGIAETLPGGSDGSDSVNGDGSNSGGTGSDQENSGGAGDAESQGDGVESSAGSQAAQNGRSSQQGSDGSDDGATADTRIDLNTATAEQLDSIPGVGPVTAQRILDHRRSIGRFTSVDQLLDVSGIGAKTLTKIRPWVRV